ncbi:hypothetical protein SY83_09815 [Paenibacillus swuensis]|uniref:Uncharacterized protein n=1 Tax=Paenibacillus swuensis TaxID=1178515 RepID=A0A172TI41_9BACL|nr:hypothetical protein SY83_09815 [Paenibacillus swuensis]
MYGYGDGIRASPKHRFHCHAYCSDRGLFQNPEKSEIGFAPRAFELRSHIEKAEIIETYLEQMGHNPMKIRGNWIQVDKAYAKTIAEIISIYFLEKFQPDAGFYTNEKFDSSSGMTLYKSGSFGRQILYNRLSKLSY